MLLTLSMFYGGMFVLVFGLLTYNAGPTASQEDKTNYLHRLWYFTFFFFLILFRGLLIDDPCSSMLEKGSQPELARVKRIETGQPLVAPAVRIQPSPTDKRADGFTWGDYEDVAKDNEEAPWTEPRSKKPSALCLPCTLNPLTPVFLFQNETRLRRPVMPAEATLLRQRLVPRRSNAKMPRNVRRKRIARQRQRLHVLLNLPNTRRSKTRPRWMNSTRAKRGARP